MTIFNKIGNSFLWRTKNLWEKLFLTRSPFCYFSHKKILLVRTDEIGDYILFRNSLEIYRKAFKNEKIVLLGNQLWKDIALKFDTKSVDQFIWINKQHYFDNNDLRYRFFFLFNLWIKGFNTIILPTYSPDTVSIDLLIHSGVKNKITSEIDKGNVSQDEWGKYLKQSIHKIQLTKSFELEKNIEFAQKVTGTNLSVELQILHSTKKKNQIIISPGAARKDKQWAPENFSSTLNLISEKDKNIQFVITGTERENEIALKIIHGLKDTSRVQNHCGKLSLVDLINEIGSSKLTISNDSSPVHIAAALGVSVVCPFKGDHYGRFLPYPNSISSNIHSILPSNFDEKVVNSVSHSQYDINSIQPSQIIECIEKYDLL